MKRILSGLLTFILIVSLLPLGTLTVSSAIFTYDANAAITFAKNHCATDAKNHSATKGTSACDNGWLCAEFVAECLLAGGFPKKLSSVAGLSGFAGQITNYGEKISSSKTGEGYVEMSSFTKDISKGDPIVLLYSNNAGSGNGHVVIYSGETASDGTLKVYAHNSRKQNEKLYASSKTVEIFAVHIGTNEDNIIDSNVSTNPDDYTYPDPNTTGTFYYTTPTMKDGNGNTYVSWIQAVLYQLEYSIEIDGSYGQKTEATVRQFQSDNGLEVDGCVGPATKRKLLELWNAKKAENSHTCDKNISSYQSAHPHYLVYKCSGCGKEQVDTTITQRMDSCNSCLPEKSILTVSADTSLDYTSFSWSTAEGADCYELIVYRNGEDAPLQWLYNLTSNNHTLQLSAGEYTAYVASINNDLIDSSCWWVYSDKVEFSVSDGGDFAPVVGSEYNGSRYELYNVRIPWYEAKAKCEELGGHLVVITSASENEAVGELVSQGGRHSYWMGMSDNDTEGMWVSVTGEVLSYENWMDGEPNNQNDEDYAVIRNADGKTWNDAGDTYHNVLVGFICEYESDAGEDVTEPSTGDEDKPIAPTEPSTNAEDKPTEPTESSTGDEEKSSDPTEPSTGDEDIPTNSVAIGLFGDANEDGKVNIKDATLIQKAIANLTTLTEIGEDLADADLNTKINIKDATAIQKHIAGIETGYPIGKPKTK